MVRRSNRLDRITRKLNSLLPAEQMQQHEHPFVWTQGTEHPNLIVQRTADRPHAHARREIEPRLRQLD